MQEHNQFQRDSDGYLINPTGWNDAFAELIASETGLELTEPHWKILNVMCQFRATEGIAPDVRHVVEHLVAQGGIEKKAAKEYLFKLSPYGYMQQACKIAGFQLQRPRAWSTR